MLQKMLLAAAALIMVLAPAMARAENDKIDPATYLCAEYQTNESVMKGQPPIFEDLQMDGYVSAAIGMDIASSDTLHVMVGQVYLWCENRPTEKVITIWQKLREVMPVPLGDWNAKTSTCADMNANLDDATGFIVWLDGYNRRLLETEKSVLNTDEDLNGFINACKAQPKRTMLEVLQESAK